MEINILSFGPITEITLNSELVISEVNSTDSLNKRLTEMFPALALVKYSMAVNKMVVQQNTQLNNGDTVALLPPFSGG